MLSIPRAKPEPRQEGIGAKWPRTFTDPPSGHAHAHTLPSQSLEALRSNKDHVASWAGPPVPGHPHPPPRGPRSPRKELLAGGKDREVNREGSQLLSRQLWTAET